jgi:two-component system, NarL family, response regulator NreC
MDKLRVLVADDHALVRQGIKLLIDSQPGMCVVAEAGDGETAWREAKNLRPDVVVMDVSMPELNGAQATERLTTCCKEIKVLALSAYQDEAHVRQLLMSGAAGYVLKKAVADELATAIRTVARGGVHLDPQIAGKVVNAYVKPIEVRSGEDSLSAREQEVLLCVAWGYSNKEIAGQLHLSVKTVEGHKARIMQKLDLKSRSDIVRYALQRGWLQDC